MKQIQPPDARGKMEINPKNLLRNTICAKKEEGAQQVAFRKPDKNKGFFAIYRFKAQFYTVPIV